MIVGSKEWDEYISKKKEKELEESLKEKEWMKDCCHEEYITKYVFDDTTEILDINEARIYSKYFNKVNDLLKELYQYMYNDDNKLGESDTYIQYNKKIINDIKKKYYNILWEIYKERYGTSKYDAYFEKFADNPLNDMQGAARCIDNIPFNWVNVNNLGYDLLSFDHLGRKFKSFRDKCDYLDKEAENHLFLV